MSPSYIAEMTDSQTSPEPPPQPGSDEPPGRASASPRQSVDGVHLVTLTHEGRFWDAFVEFVKDPSRPDSHQARLCFVPADAAGCQAPARTAVIIIEPSADAVLAHARSLAQHQMIAMLRSAT